MERIQKLIVNVANSYLGQQEIRGNRGFIDEVFEQKMRTVGWDTGQAWCAYFAELVWKEAYAHHNSFRIKDLNELFSGSAVRTYANFRKSNLFSAENIPVPGALVIWQKYNGEEPDWRGHIGIVVSEPDIDGKYWAIEGNTNSAGGREGIEVAKKLNIVGANRGSLREKGFIIPTD